MESSTVIACLTSLFSMFGLAGYIHSDNGPSLISQELRSFLLTLGIGCSNSAPYNPRGNGQVERYNGTIWKSVQLGLRSSDLKGSQWEIMLPSALHSIRTLVCVSTNQTPHERLFNFQRRTVTGHSLPSWLVQKGSALLRKGWGTIYPGTIYPGTIYPGTIYPGTIYPGTIYPGKIYPGTIYPGLN